MPKYYCDYCKSYLTHDTMSVRRSHLMGKTHIRLYCDYYEAKAKETGIWNPDDIPYEIKLDYLSRGAPGSAPAAKRDAPTAIWEGAGDDSVFSEESQKRVRLPPPPNMSGFPNPPPSVLRTTEEGQQAVFVHQKKDEE